MKPLNQGFRDVRGPSTPENGFPAQWIGQPVGLRRRIPVDIAENRFHPVTVLRTCCLRFER
jgi:hypothetical protein